MNSDTQQAKRTDTKPSTDGASTGGASTDGASTGGASTGGASTGGASTGGPHVSFSKNTSGSQSKRSSTSASAKTPALLRAKAIRKSYHKANLEIPVLCGVDIQFYENELTAIIGQSGSGKSTLLHLLATLDQPDDGEVHFDGRRIDNLPNRQRDKIRNRDIGIIFQFYHLLPELTNIENVMMPLLIDQSVLGYWRTRRATKERATELLELVGLGHRLRHRPTELSGGEMQRAAIARALVSRPKLLLADEPTGNLDRKNGEEILNILRRLNEQEDLTIVMVTHDQAIADAADRTVRLVEGRVQK